LFSFLFQAFVRLKTFTFRKFFRTGGGNVPAAVEKIPFFFQRTLDFSWKRYILDK